MLVAQEVQHGSFEPRRKLLPEVECIRRQIHRDDAAAAAAIAAVQAAAAATTADAATATAATAATATARRGVGRAVRRAVSLRPEPLGSDHGRGAVA